MINTSKDYYFKELYRAVSWYNKDKLSIVEKGLRGNLTKVSKDLLTLILIFAYIFTFAVYNAQAKSNNEHNLIDDPNHYFTEEELKLMEKEIRELPESYKLIMLPSIKGSIEEAAKTFFNIRQYSQDTILILTVADQKQIFILTGEALEKKGLNKEFFSNKINQYFVPEIKNNTVANSLIWLMKGISRDISKQIIETEGKDVPKIPTPPQEKLQEDKSELVFRPIFWIISLTLSVILIWLIAKKTLKTHK